MIINILDYLQTNLTSPRLSLPKDERSTSGNINQSAPSSGREGTVTMPTPIPFVRPRTFANPTLLDLIEVYAREYLPHRAPSTQTSVHTLLRHIAHDLGSTPLHTLDRHCLQAWHALLRQRNYSAGTIRRYLYAMSGLLTIAHRDLEWLPRNPMTLVPKPSGPTGRDRILTDAERRRLLDACDRGPSWLSLIVWLGLTTGCRKNELRHLRWEHVDFTRGQIRIVTSKNGDQRSIPLAAQSLAKLRAYHKGQHVGYVFMEHEGNLVYIDRRFATACKRAGLEDFHFHDLRHTYASYLAMSGASTVQIAELLGHRTMAMVKRYAHLNVEHLRQVQERMGREFLGE